MRRIIGKTKVSVNAIGFGGLQLSKKNSPNEPEAIKIIHAALDAGIDFIDTANVYCVNDFSLGHNEKLIRKALQSRRGSDPVYVATKGGFTRPEGEWIADGRPKSLRQACENSLEALGVDEIFLYQLHAPDDEVPFEDSVGELSRLQEEGKIINLGLPNVNASQIKTAQTIARIETVQNRFNPLCQRDLYNGVFKLCEDLEMNYIAYSPVGGAGSHVKLSEQELLVAIGADHDATSYQVALSWCLSKGKNVLAIPGASKITSVLSSVDAVYLRLSVDEIKSIDEISIAA